MNDPKIDYLPLDSPARQYTGEVTTKQIDAWKATHGAGIFRVFTADGKHVGYFKNPTRADVSACFASVDPKNQFAHIEMLGRSLWLGGSDVFMKDETVMLGQIGMLRGKMDGAKLIVENL